MKHETWGQYWKRVYGDKRRASDRALLAQLEIRIGAENELDKAMRDEIAKAFGRQRQ